MHHALTQVIIVAVLVLEALFAAVPCAEAQLLDIPPFVALDSTIKDRFGSFTMASGADSSMAVLASTWATDVNKSEAVVRHFSPTGSPLGPLVRIDETTHVSGPRLVADGRGGFIASWRLTGIGGLPLDARLLGASGAPAGPVFRVSPGFGYYHAEAPLPSGTIFVWVRGAVLEGQRYDLAGQPNGPIFVIETSTGSVYPLLVATKSDGGFVVAWSEDGHARGRVYDAAGLPLGDVSDLVDEFTLNDLATSPLGGFVVVGGRVMDTHRWPSAVWARRFDDTGVPLGTSFVVDGIDPGAFALSPHARFDPAGRLYVAWSIPASETLPRGRAYDPAGKPLQASFRLGDQRVTEVLLAARPDGRFIEGWSADGRDLTLQVRALCVPPDHTGCGNGVPEAPCERCDNGPANSDTTPDACRTTCALPSCGDGVVDSGESCDDGNLVGCDGCDATCAIEAGYVCGDGIVSADCDEQCDDGPANDDTLPNACRTSCLRAHCNDGVLDDGEGCDDANGTSCDGCSDRCVPEPGLTCGDGIPELACGEQCDDGNTIVGDGCIGSCRLERVPGGGSPASDCHIEWVVDNPTNVPLYDKHGGINGRQVCVDGDPRCDFDGGVSGSCTFHLRVCANNTDLSGCTAGPRLRSWELRVPSATKAATRPPLAAVRAAFTSVPGAVIGPTVRDVCSGTLDVAVPVRSYATGAKAGSLVLKSYATLYTGEKDSDKLKLICQP